MTTDRSPLREKMGQPEGEVEILEVSDRYNDQKEIERMNDNSPAANETDLSGNKKYVINIKKSPDKSHTKPK